MGRGRPAIVGICAQCGAKYSAPGLAKVKNLVIWPDPSIVDELKIGDVVPLCVCPACGGHVRPKPPKRERKPKTS